MFSGIVQGTGKVSKISAKKDSITIEITPPKNFTKNLKKGASKKFYKKTSERR